jgi:hypothetical protein
MTFGMFRIKETDDKIEAMKDTREICDDFGPGDSFPYNFNYLFYE